MEDNNPFKDVVSPLTSEEFVTTHTKDKAGPTLKTGEDLLKTAKIIENQARFAKKTRNRIWLEKLQRLASQMMAQVGEYLKKAIELAIYKFVVELCAMIMSALLSAWTKKGGKPMDITTSGVFYNSGGTAQPQQSQGFATTRHDNNPFGDWGNTSRNVVGAW